jgi:hypothetical protein
MWDTLFSARATRRLKSPVPTTGCASSAVSRPPRCRQSSRRQQLTGARTGAQRKKTCNAAQFMTDLNRWARKRPVGSSPTPAAFSRVLRRFRPLTVRARSPLKSAQILPSVARTPSRHSDRHPRPLRPSTSPLASSLAPPTPGPDRRLRDAAPPARFPAADSHSRAHGSGTDGCGGSAR